LVVRDGLLLRILQGRRNLAVPVGAFVAFDREVLTKADLLELLGSRRLLAA
jgi:hypothetical protein